jgi:DUF971 family protein
MPAMNIDVIPIKLTLKREEGLEITWADGRVSRYSLSYLRTMCPCATCKEVRAEGKERKSSLNILPGNYSVPLKIESVEKVGNYALQFQWSDEHGSGIYSYQYLREIMPADSPMKGTEPQMNADEC